MALLFDTTFKNLPLHLKVECRYSSRVCYRYLILETSLVVPNLVHRLYEEILKTEITLVNAENFTLLFYATVQRIYAFCSSLYKKIDHQTILFWN